MKLAAYPYTQVQGKLKDLLGKIRQVGVPSKVTIQWLKTIGYKSSNDATIIPVLKFIGFIDASGVPTERWAQYRGGKFKTVLGAAIREGYADLYAVYPDAHERNQKDLEDVFSTSSTAGKAVVTKTVTTFKTLVGEAEFSPGEALDATAPLHAPLGTPDEAHSGKSATHRGSSGPSLHVDIQIHISPDSSPEQIDQIFASMAKHLYPARG